MDPEKGTGGGGGGGGGLDPPGKSQVTICSLRDTGSDTPLETIGHLGSIASRRSSVRPSVKYIDD